MYVLPGLPSKGKKIFYYGRPIDISFDLLCTVGPLWEVKDSLPAEKAVFFSCLLCLQIPAEIWLVLQG